MHTFSADETKVLLSELLSRVEEMETLCSETSRKLEDLNRKVQFLLAAELGTDSVAEIASVNIVTETANTPRTNDEKQGNDEKTSWNLVHSLPLSKPLPELEQEPRKQYHRKPRQPAPHRRNRANSMAPMVSPFLLDLDENAVQTIRSLLEMIPMENGETGHGHPEKMRFPFRSTGKPAFRRESPKRGVSAVPNETFEDANAGTRHGGRPWILLATALVLIAMIFMGGMKAAAKLSGRTSPTARAEAPAQTQPIAFTIADSRKVLEDFLSSSSLEEAVGHAWDPDAGLLDRMREFYSPPGKTGWQDELVDNQPARTGYHGGNDFHFWRVRLADGNIRIAPVVQIGGRALVYPEIRS